MLKSSNRIIVSIFILFLLGINIFNICIADRRFSELENRMLAQKPKFTMKSLVSGRFTSKFEEYITDQFAFRDFWVGIKSDVERLTLKTINNGIFFGKDGYLLEDYKKPDEQLIENIKIINTFASRLSNVSTHLLLVPNSVKIYEDKLPLFASPYDQLKTIKKVKEGLNSDIGFVDVYDALIDKKNEYIYFKTDHHWTMRGAYYAYEQLAKLIGTKPYDIKDFTSEIVSNDFYGTFYSKANNRHISPDPIEIFRPDFDITYEIYYADEDRYNDTLYELKHLDKKDKYAVFLDGNHSLMTIKTNVKNNKKIVIFKDSYSHCFIPFLTNHYEEIHVIDLRYYKLNAYEYIEEHDINEALFLYSVSNFSEDKNIKWLR